MTSSAGAFRKTLLRGILLILPLAITFVVLRWLFRLVTGFSAPIVAYALTLMQTSPEEGPLLRYLTPLIALPITLGVVLLVGALGGHYLGRRLLAWLEGALLRLPLVRWVYGAARQLMDAFSATGSGAFREVVFVEYPRRGLWCLGFVSAQAAGVPAGMCGEDPLYVFLPSTPNPTSGYTVVVARDEAVPAGMTVEEGLKLVVSGGFITPGSRAKGVA